MGTGFIRDLGHSWSYLLCLRVRIRDQNRKYRGLDLGLRFAFCQQLGGGGALASCMRCSRRPPNDASGDDGPGPAASDWVQRDSEAPLVTVSVAAVQVMPLALVRSPKEAGFGPRSSLRTVPVDRGGPILLEAATVRLPACRR
jgi:hypothetical protein